MHVIAPVVHVKSSVDYGNMKSPSMHLVGLGSAALAAAVALPR